MIRILIVDDQKFARQTLQNILIAESDFEVIGEAENGVKAIEYIEIANPDIAIVDLEMPEMDGFTVTRLVHERFPNTKILILSSYDDAASISRAVQEGANGYLLKSNSRETIVDAIRYVQRGYFQLSSGLFEKLIFHLINDKSQEQTKIIELQEKYSSSLEKLEQNFIRKNEGTRLELITEIDQQINNLKKEFRIGLEAFQQQVSERLQTGLNAFNEQYRSSNFDTTKLEKKLNQRYFEQQLLVDKQIERNQQYIKYLKTKVDLISYVLGFLTISYLAEKILVFVFSS
jgi:DNA-binding NarL/FixJ family response regulator